MSSRLKVSLALLVGFVGLAIAGANLPVDTQLTIRTKLGKRTQPHWLVPTDSKIVRTEGGSGLFRLVGGLLGCAGFATAMHLAGEDERQQRLFWDKQIVADGIQLKEDEVSAEINAGVRLKKLQMDAQADVDFYSLQLQGKFREAIGFVPELVQPALPHGKPGTLDEITTPGDKVGEGDLEAIEGDMANKIPSLTNYPSVLIYGVPGSGKTTFAEEEVKRRQSEGHEVIVLDPHQAYGSWTGCEVVGGGMNYEAIDKKLGWFAQEVKDRYKRIQTEPNPKFDSMTLVCDEFTNWADRCQNSAEFFRTAVTDIRKAKMLVLIVSHSRTLTGLANAKGLAALRDAALLEIETLGQKDKVTGLAVPRFEVLVKLPGISLRDRFLVKTKRHPLTPSHTLPTPSHTNAPDMLTPLPCKASGDSHQSHHPIPEGWKFGDPKAIDSATRGVIVACIRCGWSQTRTIQEVFGLAKGGTNSSYDLARITYQEIYRLIH